MYIEKWPEDQCAFGDKRIVEKVEIASSLRSSQ